jgi:putative MFS transporter
MVRNEREGRAEALFRRPWAFWVGIAAVTTGVLLHLPNFIGARDMHYVLRGMGWDTWMILGMSLIASGYVAFFYGLAPHFGRHTRESTQLEVKALDETRLGPAHLKLMAVLAIAIAVDTMKPFTFTFILPGVANEYNLRSPSHPAAGHWPVALFPFAGIVGTVLGSLIWGHLADRIGRRPTILLAAAMFIGTAMCGAMPEFYYNLAACFVMGLSAGGLLPIAYSLLTETIPAKRRGQVVVLVAGLGTAAGFLLASWTANWLIPSLSWRIMWWLGIPTGLVLIVLNRYMPESPRFLLAQGRRDEALTVMNSFGIAVTEKPLAEPVERPARLGRPGYRRLMRPPYFGITAALTAYGLAWGLINFGFLVWLPVHLAHSGVSAGHVTYILAKAALFSIPGAVFTAWLYGRWSSHGTLIAAAALTAGVLGVFAGTGVDIARHSALFTGLLVVLLVSMWAMISVLAPYGAEVYPTQMRGAGAGAVAGASKLGGVFALSLSVFSVAPPGLSGAAVLAIVPAGLAALMLVAFGIETRGRRLEEISAAQLGASAS